MPVTKPNKNLSDSQPLMAAVVIVLGLFLLTSCGNGEGGPGGHASAKHFSPDYVTARTRFRGAVEQAGGKLTALELAAKGPKGEDLTIDIAWFGAEKPKRAFVHSSGLHGVEAFAGSAVQLQWLSEGIPALPEDSALVLIHVLNPYGMAWLRRFNENSVDLNRNSLVAGETYEGAPKGYAELDGFLNPPSPPSWDFYYVRALWLVRRHGMTTLKQAIAGGQYINPKGLFFGGESLEEGPRKVQAYVRERLSGVEHLVVVDVHTGLGPFGVDTLLLHTADQGMALFKIMRETFGERVASMDPEESVAYRIKGTFDAVYADTLPQAEVYFVCQEFGTYHAVRALKAIRDENRWHHYGDGTIAHPTKAELKEKFSPDDEFWRQTVLDRGREVIAQALGLAFGN